MSLDVAAARKAGRPRQFEEDTVIETLMHLFWEFGYEGTSLTDIINAAGLNKSSFYNAFGSKEDVFRTILDRYLEVRTKSLAAVGAGTAGLDDVLRLVELVRTEAMADGGDCGCLGVNTCAELGNTRDWASDWGDDYRDAVRSIYRSTLQRAADQQELKPDMVETYVATMFSFMVSGALIARSGAEQPEINHHVDSMRQLVNSWHTTC